MTADDEVKKALTSRLDVHRNDPRRFDTLAGLADGSSAGLSLGGRLLGAGLALAVAAGVTVLALNTDDGQLIETARPTSATPGSTQPTTTATTAAPSMSAVSPSPTSGTDAASSDSLPSTETTAAAGTSEANPTLATTGTSEAQACDIGELLPAGVIDTGLIVGDSTIVLDKLPGGQTAVLEGGEGSIDFRIVLVHQQTCEAVVAALADGNQATFTLTARPDEAVTFICLPESGSIALVQTTSKLTDDEWSGESQELRLDSGGLVSETQALQPADSPAPGVLMNCGDVLLPGIWS